MKKFIKILIIPIIIIVFTIGYFAFAKTTTIEEEYIGVGGDLVISITIRNGNVDVVKEAFANIYSIPEICTTTPEEIEECAPEFTERKWIKRSLRNLINKTVERWEQKKAIDLAKEQVEQSEDITE